MAGLVHYCSARKQQQCTEGTNSLDVAGAVMPVERMLRVVELRGIEPRTFSLGKRGSYASPDLGSSRRNKP